MECAEYRRIVITHIPTEITRAERAAVLAHYCCCESCLTWVAPAKRPMNLAEHIETQLICELDYHDPEFLSVVKDALRGSRS